MQKIEIKSRTDADELLDLVKDYHIKYIEQKVREMGNWDLLAKKLDLKPETLYNIWKRSSLSPILRLSNDIYDKKI
ncbi:hypothetical protein [Leptospira noguchii]|uniref:Uncharacterized protein n=1 Tax=Leptospira noguchii TaxID=28182 RepID=M6VAJ0_9LEPT|nr:hypothetical protein [Leptospira noguchii]EMO53900.1 hypothetical protein LEP1GSC172_3274 [Leptospira noguchii]